VSLAIAGAVAAFQIPTIFGDSILLLEVLCAAAWLPCHRSFVLPLALTFFRCSAGFCVGEICHSQGVDHY